MEEQRRSGTERRQNYVPPEEERRTTSDRRELLVMPDRTKERLMGMLIFSGMNIEEIIAVVSICAKKEIHANTVLYTIGDPSDDMLILVKGTLAVLSRGGVELQTYEPYDAIGEMGIFTDEPRSATVKAVTDVTVLRIDRTELFHVFDTDRDLKEKLLINVIKVVCDKLRRQNEIVEQQLYKIRRLEIL